MDGIHDLGGMQGFGRVRHTINTDPGPTFKQDWEALGYGGILLGVEKGFFSVDEIRHAVERLEPRYYLMTPYYERYVIGVASLLVEKGVITQKELEKEAGGPFPLALPAISEGRPARNVQFDFKVGDRVRVVDEHFAGHIRCPAYCRNKVGVVLARTNKSWAFPDSIGHGREDHGSEPTLYVEFAASDIWRDVKDDATVVVDLFAGYLEAA